MSRLTVTERALELFQMSTPNWCFNWRSPHFQPRTPRGEQKKGRNIHKTSSQTIESDVSGSFVSGEREDELDSSAALRKQLPFESR